MSRRLGRRFGTKVGKLVTRVHVRTIFHSYRNRVWLPKEVELRRVQWVGVSRHWPGALATGDAPLPRFCLCGPRPWRGSFLGSEAALPLMHASAGLVAFGLKALRTRRGMRQAGRSLRWAAQKKGQAARVAAARASQASHACYRLSGVRMVMPPRREGRGAPREKTQLAVQDRPLVVITNKATPPAAAPRRTDITHNKREE